ncbi:MAG: helix-turn-helix transcriptional regulator [Solirubrobacterales bacterium]
MANPKSRALGSLIRAQRELQHLPMRTVASMAGISNPYLSQIERGLRAPSDRVLSAIAESLQTSADALREGAGVAAVEEAQSEVVTAINADPRLSASQKRALLEIYESFALDPTDGDG